MRLTWRDGLATLLVAAAIMLYALWATGAAIESVSTRWMTVITFALGMAACTTNQGELGEIYTPAPGVPRPPAAYVTLATALGIVMLVAGIIAFVLASEMMLATLAVAMAGLWLLATGRHALAGRHLHRPAHPAAR